MQPALTPSQIGAAFAAVGRDVPHADVLVEIAEALCAPQPGGLDGLCAYVEAQTGASYPLRRYLPEYRNALAEAANPALYAERLLIEADEREGWAVQADAEADYRAACRAKWIERGDMGMASAYGDREAAERRFAKHCREWAAERRATAASLTQAQAA